MFSLTRWQPNNQMSRKEQGTDPLFGELLRSFDDVWREVDAPFALLRSNMFQTEATPAVDISESEEALYVTVDVPGYESKDIDVTVEGDVLRICGKAERREDRGLTHHRVERRHQSFERTFSLPATVDPRKTEAACKNGVLTITLPKREEARPKSITVKVQS